jgi:gluconolactonase
MARRSLAGLALILIRLASGQQREAVVAAIPGVVALGAKWTLAWQGADNADGIIAASDGGLLFAQEQPSRVGKLDQNDVASVFLEDTHGAGALAIDSKGRILAVERTCTDPGGRPDQCSEPTAVAILAPQRKVLAYGFKGRGLGRLNDLVVDKKGGAYFNGTGTYYADANGKVSSIGENLRTNGIMLSRNEKILYAANGKTIVAFDIESGGVVKNQREFATLEAGGTGDGMAIDSEGRLYVTSAPGVQVIGADGKYLGLIPTPRNAISAAFSGPAKKTLYVVTSGALGPDGGEFKTPPGVRNNAKTIYRIPMQSQGFLGRAK